MCLQPFVHLEQVVSLKYLFSIMSYTRKFCKQNIKSNGCEEEVGNTAMTKRETLNLNTCCKAVV